MIARDWQLLINNFQFQLIFLIPGGHTDLGRVQGGRQQAPPGQQQHLPGRDSQTEAPGHHLQSQVGNDGPLNPGIPWASREVREVLNSIWIVFIDCGRKFGHLDTQKNIHVIP